MSWEKKGRSRFFYHSIRSEGQVRKVYVGQGRQAEELSRQIEQRKQERQARRETLRQEVERVEVAEEKLQQLQDMADTLMRAVLMGMGLHEHKGQWRRRRYGTDSRVDRNSRDHNNQVAYDAEGGAAGDNNAAAPAGQRDAEATTDGYVAFTTTHGSTPKADFRSVTHTGQEPTPAATSGYFSFPTSCGPTTGANRRGAFGRVAHTGHAGPGVSGIGA